MKVAIMQPYLFPYIGYFQLIYSVDTFIFYDDVTYIKGGWINRNSILLNGKSHRFTIPLHKSSSNKLIKNIVISNNQNWKKKLLKSINQAYKKAPYYFTVFPIISDILQKNTASIAALNINAIKTILDYLQCPTNIQISSKLSNNGDKHKILKVISICKYLEATTYINAPGAAEMYKNSVHLFKDANITLNILHPQSKPYSQFNHPFIPNLSILDILMFNSQEKVIDFLKSYKIEECSQ